MRKICFIITLFIAVYTHAQQKHRKFDANKFKTELYQFVTNQASLTQQEAAAFFPLYEEMLTKQRVLFKKKKECRMNKPADEKGCKQMILTMDKLEVQIKEIQATYHKKFLNVLPASKLYEVLQAEENFHRQAFKRMAKTKR